MSRQFDEYYDLLPHNLIDEDYVVHNGVEYRRMEEFPDYYITSNGEIYSNKKGELKEMATWTNQHGHLYTRLVDQGIKRTVSIHREVAKAYLNKPEGCNVVRHLDDDPSNNWKRNLAWGTHADNTRDCREHGRMYMRPVYCIEDGMIYDSCADLARKMKVSKALVTKNCQNGKLIKGKHYNYLDEGGKK